MDILELILRLLRSQVRYRHFEQIAPSTTRFDPPLDAIWLSAADTVTYKDLKNESVTVALPAQHFFPVGVSELVSVSGAATVYGARL